MEDINYQVNSEKLISLAEDIGNLESVIKDAAKIYKIITGLNLPKTPFKIN